MQALHKFYLIAPNQVQHIHSKFRKALCDKDPGVMAASLHIYLQMIKVVQRTTPTLTLSHNVKKLSVSRLALDIVVSLIKDL